jgi:REP element-mobilizing transposase RayT
MTNQVHLLSAPPAVNSLALLLKQVAGRQTRYVNRLEIERRMGTLWEVELWCESSLAHLLGRVFYRPNSH